MVGVRGLIDRLERDGPDAGGVGPIIFCFIGEFCKD